MKPLQKRIIFHPQVVKSCPHNPDLLRIHLTPDYTKVDFGYVAKDIYENGGWIRISPGTFIENKITKQRCTLVSAENIPLAPLHHYFETTKDWRYFSLIFPAIPPIDCILNIIEEENGTTNDFNYFGVDINMQEGVEMV